MLLLAILQMLGTEALASGEAEEAEINFQLGTKAYARGDYDEALAEFLASNRLAPNSSVAYNIARCYALLGKNAEAYRWFTAASEGLVGDKQAIKDAVAQEIASIVPKVVLYEIVSDPPGATVYINRKDLGAVGVTPFKLAMNPTNDPRKFILEKEGWLDSEIDNVKGSRGEQLTVSGTLSQVVGTLKVDAPEGTEVHQGAPDGPLICDAPCEAKLAPGNWVLYFRKEGYREAVRQLEVFADQVSATTVELQPNTGSVVVDATERGSLIEIDGKAVGFTPTVVQVPVGERTVKVSRPGYEPVVRQVMIETDQQAILDDLQLLPLNEVTAVSRRVERVELAPSSVTIIGQEELKAFQYPTIYEALRGVRGVALTYDSIYGAASVRGLGQANDFGNRLLILSDGATLNDNILYQSFISYDGRVDLGGIERIEVVRGPGSVMYGTGAVSGVVNLVGESNDALDGTEIAVGTYDNHVLRARAQSHYSFGEDGDYGFRATVSGAASQGREEIVDPRGDLNPPLAVQGFDQFEGGTTSGRLWLKDATIQWFHTARKVDIPTGVYATILGNEEGDNEWIDRRTMVEARYEPQLSEAVGLLTRAYFNRYQYDGFLPYRPYTSVERYIGVSVGAEARAVIEPSDVFRLSTGVQVDTSPVLTLDGEDRKPDGTTSPYLDESQPYFLGAAYALADIVPVDSVRITAGGRIDYWSTFGVAFSPRVALVLVPDEGDYLKILGGRSFRAPSIYELYYNIPGVQTRPDYDGTVLLPETVWSGEVEYSHQFDPVWTGLLAGHASLANQLIETVSPNNLDGSVTYRNSDLPIQIFGLDVEVRRGFQGGWMVSSFYSYLDSRYTDGVLVPNAPQNNAGMKLIVPISAPTARIAFRSSLEAPRRIDLTRSDSTGLAVISDIVLSGSVPERGLEYGVGINNLFNMRYSQPLGDTFPFRTMPQQGRSLMANLAMRF